MGQKRNLTFVEHQLSTEILALLVVSPLRERNDVMQNFTKLQSLALQ